MPLLTGKRLAGCGKIVLSERFLPSLFRFVSLESCFGRISCCRPSRVCISGRCADTRTRTYYAGTAIKFRMRTRL